MAITKLTLESIKLLSDGVIDEAFQQHIAKCISDCEDRPGNKTARKITMVVEIKPAQYEGGQCAHADVEFKLKSSVPDHISRPLQVGIRRNGVAVFNDMSEANPDQKTIDQQIAMNNKKANGKTGDE